MNNIFNITDITDLPVELGLNKPEPKPTIFEQRIVSLLTLANPKPLSIDEPTAGYYRGYLEIMHRDKMRDKLWQCTQHRGCKFEKVPNTKRMYRLKKATTE